MDEFRGSSDLICNIIGPLFNFYSISDNFLSVKMLHTVFTKTLLFSSLCSGSIQLSDFGLAIVDGAQNKNNIKLSGTVGYVAPEYLLDGMSIEPVIIASLFQCVW